MAMGCPNYSDAQLNPQYQMELQCLEFILISSDLTSLHSEGSSSHGFVASPMIGGFNFRDVVGGIQKY